MAPARRGYPRPVGDWNNQRVTVVGSEIRVELNGTLILDCDLAEIELPPSGREHPGRMRTRGHFGFAGHGDPVELRYIFTYGPDAPIAIPGRSAATTGDEQPRAADG